MPQVEIELLIMTDHSEFTVGGFSVKHLSTWHDALLIDSRQLLKLLLMGIKRLHSLLSVCMLV